MSSLLGYSVPETLTDDAGNALKAITVVVTGPGAYSGTAVTDGTSGVLRLGPLPVGDYTVSFGARTVTVPVVPTSADIQTAYDLAAAAASAGSVSTAVAGEATARATAVTAALATAASDATTKAAAAQAAAIAAAATDASTKASAAQAAAISTAASDATTKASAAQAAAIAAAASAGSSTFLTVVVHGSTAGTTRPPGAVRVLWRGTVQPTNMAVGDIYEDISTPATPTQKIATSIGPVVLASLGGGSGTLAALTDVTAGTPTYGTQLVYDPPTSKYKATAGPKFTTDLQLYLPSSTAFSFWKAALARSRSLEGVARLHHYGDSLTNSFRCLSPYETWAYPELVRAKMAASGLFGTVTEGPIWGNMTTDSRVTIPANWNSGWSTMPGGGPGAFWIDGGTSAADFTFGPVTCDRFHLYFYQRSDSATTITVSIDGGANQTATLTAPGTANFQKATFIASGGVGSHTLALKKPSQGAGFKMFVCAIEYGTGVESTVGTTRAVGQAATNRTGVAVSRAGVNGTTTTNWSTYVAGTLDGGYDIVAPDLTVLYLGTNDINNAIAVATYKANLTTMIGRARARLGDVLLVSPHTSNVTNIGNLPNYQAALYQLCDEQNVGLFDLSARWPGYVAAQAEPYAFTTAADGSHPNQRGYSDIANGVFDCIRRISGY